jgi:hypothetical protein
VRWTAALATALLVALPATLAGADSFDPVTLNVTIARTARLHHKLTVRVTVTADPGVLDTRTAPLRVAVKLASECATYQYTMGTVLLNRALNPQPATGHAYRATARGTGRPASVGKKTVCVWLLESGDGRVFASDQSDTVTVKRR